MTEADRRPFTFASFNQYLSERRLMGTRCPACDRIYLPPRAVCPRCHGGSLEWVELAGRGRLAAYTCIYVAPSAMIAAGYGRDNPYCSGIVELDEGVKMSALILGVDAKDPPGIRIGAPVAVDFVEQGAGDARHMVLAFRVLP
jgi:uncharacterized protein